MFQNSLDHPIITPFLWGVVRKDMSVGKASTNFLLTVLRNSKNQAMKYHHVVCTLHFSYYLLLLLVAVEFDAHVIIFWAVYNFVN